MNKLPPFSHTMLSDLGNCMWKGYRKYIAKDLPKEEKSPAQQLGIQVHECFEKAINEKDPSLVPQQYQHWVTPLTAMNAKAEVKLGVNEDGSAAEFFGEPWGRGVADVLIVQGTTAFLLDWKTGKKREDSRELMAQSYLVKCNYPAINKVSGSYVWLQENKMGQNYDLTNTDRWLNGTRSLLNKAQEALDSGVWKKSPNPLCGWCPVKDCEHNRS